MIFKANCTQNTYYFCLIKSYTVSRQAVIFCISRAVTKIFQKAGIKIAFTTKHTIGNILRQQCDQADEYDNSGVYQLECTDCGKQYIGQTGRSFKTRFKEHKRDYETNSTKSLSAKHLLEKKTISYTQ
jgi:hypothetical protein